MTHYTMEKNIFGRFLQAFSKKKILKCHIKHCFKISDKQGIKMPIKGEYVRFKIYDRKIK